MGSQKYSAIGRGMTVHEARMDALEADRDYHGHEEGYNGGISSARSDEPEKVTCIKKPRIPKRCKVEKEVQKGARKWKTVYVLSTSFMTRNSDTYKEVDTTQGDAVKQAKAMALKSGMPVTIDIVKRLSTGNGKIAVVRPNNAEMGQWRFDGWARC